MLPVKCGTLNTVLFSMLPYRSNRIGIPQLRAVEIRPALFNQVHGFLYSSKRFAGETDDHVGMSRNALGSQPRYCFKIILAARRLVHRLQHFVAARLNSKEH